MTRTYKAIRLFSRFYYILGGCQIFAVGMLLASGRWGEAIISAGFAALGLRLGYVRELEANKYLWREGLK